MEKLFALAISKGLLKIEIKKDGPDREWILVEYNEPQSDTPSVNGYKWKLVCAGHSDPQVILMHIVQRLCSVGQDLNIMEAAHSKANDKLRRIATLIDEGALVKNGITKEIINIISE